MSTCSSGRTALHYAAASNALHIIKYLVSVGSPPNARDSGLNTPLHLTSSLPTAVALLMSGARIDLKNANNRRAVALFDEWAGEARSSALTAFADAQQHFATKPDTVEYGGDATAPAWVGDEQSDACLLCADTFSLTKRRHHCRRCGLLVCGSCSSKRYIIKGLSSTASPTTTTGASSSTSSSSLSRCCDSCYNKLAQIQFEIERKQRQIRLRQAQLNKEAEQIKRMSALQRTQTEALLQRPAHTSNNNTTSSSAAASAAKTTNMARQNVKLAQERGEALDRMQQQSSQLSGPPLSTFHSSHLTVDS